MESPNADKPRENDALSEDDLPGAATGLDDATEMTAERQRVSNRTNVHDEGSGANETEDGLSESDEALRHAAEDIPTGQDPLGPMEATPVFDRGSLPPKI